MTTGGRRTTVELGSMVRRRPGLLSRSTAAGYLFYSGGDVVAVTGVGAEILEQIVDKMPVEVLVDRQAAVSGSDRGEAAATVLAALADLQQRSVLEVLE